MTTAATSLLGLALPVTGELSGTWGDTVNNSITSLIDSAVAGTTTLSTDADVTLTTTNLAANQARQAIILWTAAGTVTRTITAPAQSKTYVVINKSSTQSIKVVGVGPTAGVTLVAGESAIVTWNGTDFAKTSSSLLTALTGTLAVANGGTGVTTSTGSGSVVLSTSPTLVTPVLGTPTSGNFSTGTFTWPTFNQNTTGTAANVTGTVAVANGGTGVTTSTGTGSVVLSTSPTLVTPALGTPTSGNFSSGSFTWPTFNQNTTGNAATATNVAYSGLTGTVPTWNQNTTGNAATATNVAYSGLTGTVPTWNQNTTGTAANVTGTVAVANGGTGLTSTPANGALDIGNGTGFTRTTLTAGANITITNSAGGITIAASSGGGGTVTAVTGTAPIVSSGGTAPAISITQATTSTNGYLSSTDWNTFNGKQAAGSYVTVGGALGTPSSGTLTNCTFPTLNQNTSGTAAGLSATLAVSSGGTGTTSLTANNVLLGNGTSAVQVVAPSTSGNVLTSNGSTWTSAAPTGSGLGIGQTYQDVTGSRTSGTSYTNSTSKPILVYVGAGSGSIVPVIGGVTLPSTASANGNTQITTSFVVPPSTTYSVTASGLASWIELR
jgi:hypothetical protein